MAAQNKFTASDLWAAIDESAARSGMTLAHLARKADLAADLLLPHNRCSGNGQPCWPSLPAITAIVAAAGLTLPQFAKFVDAAQVNRTRIHRTEPTDQGDSRE